MTPNYQFWAHRQSGEKYAVRIDNGGITGVCGPLHYTNVQSALLPDFHYDNHPEDVQWVKERESEFCLYEETER